MSQTKLLLEVVQDIQTLADSLQVLCDALLANESKVEVETPVAKSKMKAKTKESKLSLEDVRAVLASKSQAGKTAEVRELIEKYGANKLSDVNAKHYADLLKDAEAL
ncbi:rRNA biogenesis protein rrp5 [Pseudolactococcus insecticola]|uniref:rRNA biogenesis protein rrp5 n=1 Tax=Pseudolactococcus insecticola TaxID=2709158 RepID=A0A6A0B6Y4_9LACT|nr:rRNA biogenesis protein rrp5 [Lactococcus insecticola]GFH40261.1 hypothetical protein Hs20B_06590 [Lactococcus insecticola]